MRNRRRCLYDSRCRDGKEFTVVVQRSDHLQICQLHELFRSEILAQAIVDGPEERGRCQTAFTRHTQQVIACVLERPLTEASQLLQKRLLWHTESSRDVSRLDAIGV